MEHRIPLLVVCGPTASGKTDLAVRLAKELDGEVISADSMQIYRRMDIGTAKPDAAEKDGVPHHLLDILEPGEEFSLVEYLARAKAAAADIYGRGRLPVLAGGTGLYIHCLVDGVRAQEIPAAPWLHTRLAAEAAEHGSGYLWERLAGCDPELAGRLHPNNLGRVIRGLEVYALTGVTMSELQRRSRLGESPYRPCILGLCFRERETLYRRIDARVEDMLRRGLVEEAKRLWEAGVSKTAAQAIGYKELFDVFAGLCALEEGVERIKRRSRNYAKRQMTWLRRDARVHWLAWEDYGSPGALWDAAVGLARSGLATTIDSERE